MTVRLGRSPSAVMLRLSFTASERFGVSFLCRNLVLVDWLTMITEFVGMTAALSIFGVPPLVTVIVAWILMGAMVIQGRYWT